MELYQQPVACSASQTRTFTATDACGNTATASTTVTWTSDLITTGIITGVITTLLDVIHLL